MNMEQIECGLTVVGIDDSNVEETFLSSLGFFVKRGHLIADKVEFVGEGKIKIAGLGQDKRCAFCEYFRKAVLEHFKEKQTGGEISLINCPFNPNKRINYTPEVEEARKNLLGKLQEIYDSK